MSLDDYKTAFDNAYEEIFTKTLVGKAIANLRFEPALKYGGVVTRMVPDMSAVRVRTVSRGTASTIDTITDSTESLTINIEKEAVFYVSDGEATQCGPLNPGEFFGSNIAQKVSADLDGRILYETDNAAQTFDEGDLTTNVSTGTPIFLTSTTVPQMVTRMPAKLVWGKQQTIANMAFVIDSYAAADISQYLLGKQFDIVESVFKNGYAGDVSTAKVYVSENLTSEVVLTITGALNSTAGSANSFTINGVTFYVVTSTPTTAGQISCGATLDQAMTNIMTALEDPYTTVAGTYYTVGDDDASLVAGSVGLECATTAATTMQILAKGGGRIVVTENISGGTFGTPFLHCYYGKKGAIDVVVQDLAPVDMRRTSTMRGTNVFSSYLAGIKTFADGAKKFLDVQIRTAA
jgi:hypothetical protein